jgi:uncharacterized protein YqgC (DUF456 family)
MDTAHVLVFILALILMLAGIIGSFIPIIPGLPLNWLVFLGYGFWSGWETYGFWTMVWTGAVTAVGVIGEQVAGALGAKKFGSGKAGMIGAVVGAIAGLLVFNIPGLILGTFAGAMAAEMIFNRMEAKQAANAGVGALLGCMAGSVFKFVLSTILTVYFVWLAF